HSGAEHAPVGGAPLQHGRRFDSLKCIPRAQSIVAARTDSVERRIGTARQTRAQRERRAIAELPGARESKGEPVVAAIDGGCSERVPPRERSIPEEVDAKRRPQTKVIQEEWNPPGLVFFSKGEKVDQPGGPMILLRRCHQRAERGSNYVFRDKP